MSMEDREPSPYSESKFTYLGAERETFLLSPLEPEVIEPLLTIVDEARRINSRMDLMTAVGTLLHVSIAREKLNGIGFDRASKEHVLGKLLTMTDQELVCCTLQLINYSNRSDQSLKFSDLVNAWAGNWAIDKSNN
jgi:hypothetical protein